MSRYTNFWATNLVDGATQLSRRHADNNASVLQSSDLLLGSTFSPSNDCSSVTHPPARRSSQTSDERHHRLGIWTLGRKDKNTVLRGGGWEEKQFFFLITTSQETILNSYKPHTTKNQESEESGILSLLISTINQKQSNFRTPLYGAMYITKTRMFTTNIIIGLKI